MSAMGGGLNLGTLFINISADVDDAVAAIQKFGKDTATELDKQKEKWDGLKNVGQGMSQLGGTLTAALTLPIAGIGAAAVSAAGEFESSMNKITAVGGQTGGELEQLRAQAMKLGADTKYSAQEAAEGMGNLAAAGFDTTKIMGAMPGVLDLAAAGELSVARAAEVTSDTLSQFGLEAGQAGHVADVFAQGAAASSISVEQMAQSMKYAGPIAQSAGISLEQAATATALLGNAGIKGEQAGTSLRGVISSLISPSKAAAAALTDLGVTTEDSAGKMLPLDNIFAQLQQKGATTADMFKIFGENAASAASVLTKDAGPAWVAMTGEIDKSEGAAKRMADTLNSGTKGAFEQLKGSIDTVLIALGQSLLPILTKLIEAGTKFVNEWILPAVTAFGKLDPTLQTIIIALVAMLAALGPILLVAGQLVVAISAVAPVLAVVGGAIATFVGALSAPVIAIAAVTAALVALGVWVYANWDSIVAVLTVAWDAVKEAFTAFATWVGGWFEPIWQGVIAVWNAVMVPYLKLLALIWSPVLAAFELAWNAIGAFLSGVWNGIRSTAESVWSAVTGAIKTFLQWCEKIPGVNKLFNLDDAWRSAKKLGDETKKAGEEAKKATPELKAAGKAITEHGTAAGAAAPKVGALSKAVVEQKDAAIQLTKATKDFVPPAKAFHEVIEEMHKKTVPASKELDNLRIAAEASEKKFREMHEPVAALGAYMKATFTPNATAAAAAVEAIGSKSNTAKPEVVLLKEALAALGIDGGERMSKLAKDADAAYQVIVASDKTTQFQKDSAFIKLLEAEQAAMRAAGEAIPADHQKLLDAMKAKTENTSTGLPATVSKFEEFGTKVQGIISSAADDMVHSLFEGDFSFGEKGKALLKSLGQAAVDTFITPFKTAIEDLLSGAIKDLLSGKGLGGILSDLKSIGKKAADVFPSGGGGTAPPTTIPGGGGGGAGGGAGAAGSSLTGWISAISGAVTAISSVIGNFQMAGMNKSLDLIVNHTLRIYNDLAGFKKDAWDRWEQFQIIKDDIINRMNTLVDNSNLARLQLNDMIGADNRHEELFNRMVTAQEQIAVSSNRDINITVTGSDPATTASYLATRLRSQGAFA